MRIRNDILSRLDQSASRLLGFPAFCNAHVLYGSAVLRAFLRDNNWIIAFDVVGFRLDICEYDYSIYYTSDIEGYERGVTGIYNYLSVSEKPLQCDDIWGNFGVDIMTFTSTLNGEQTLLHLSPADYMKAGVDVTSNMSTGGKVLRLLVHMYGQRLFVPPEVSLGKIGVDPSSVVLACEVFDWEHASFFSGKTVPSEIPFFQSLADGLEQGGVDVTALPRESNTHWSNWIVCDDLGRS